MNGHEKWKKEHSKELKAARELYKKSKNFNPNVNIEKVGDEIFDMLDEQDWEKLTVIQKKLREEAGFFVEE
jgi:hypothetical protein